MIFNSSDKKSIIGTLGLGYIFGIIALVAIIIAIIPLVRLFLIKSQGKEIEATVYGYLDDMLLINGQPAQIVKLLVYTDEGLRFILYQTGDIKRPYSINKKIKIKAYKNMFTISKQDKYYF